MKTAAFALSFVCLAATACTGEITGVGEEPAKEGEGFTVPRDRIELLPYHVRLRRVQDVAGIPTGDPALEGLRTGAADLGAHDFSRGIRPNLTWDTATMALWVKALEPVCASDAMHQRYPSFPEDLPALLGAAYGREAAEGEAEDIWSASASLDDALRYQTTCLAVLSSLEFVAR